MTLAKIYLLNANFGYEWLLYAFELAVRDHNESPNSSNVFGNGEPPVETIGIHL